MCRFYDGLSFDRDDFGGHWMHPLPVSVAPDYSIGVTGNNEEGCIRRADARDRLPPSRYRPAGYNPVELSRDWHGLCFMEIE
jgi:hypothetical protein